MNGSSQSSRVWKRAEYQKLKKNKIEGIDLGCKKCMLPRISRQFSRVFQPQFLGQRYVALNPIFILYNYTTIIPIFSRFRFFGHLNAFTTWLVPVAYLTVPSQLNDSNVTKTPASRHTHDPLRHTHGSVFMKLGQLQYWVKATTAIIYLIKER